MDIIGGSLTVASAADWLWEQFGDSLFDDVSDGAKSAWKKLKWQSSQRQYIARMLYEHSMTSVLGNPKKISLNEVFTDVYVLDQLSAFRRLHNEELGRDAHSLLSVEDDAKRKPLLDVMQKLTRLYVLGKPGAGKSTFLKKVVLECCSGRINKTPIFVGLKSWSDSQLSLISYIEQEFEICAFPKATPFVERLLKGGRAIVMFDGLDEVSNTVGERRLLIDKLTAFTRKYPEILIVVTCRIAATDYSFDKFTYVEIADFDAQQQLTFASKWFANDEAKARKFREEWAKSESTGFRDLARTPLLLTLLCLAFDETMHFPVRRVELYEEAFNALLRRWDGTRGIPRDDVYKSLSHVRREQLLARLAALTFFDGQFLIPVGIAKKLLATHLAQFPLVVSAERIDSLVVLRAIEAQHGLLVERARDVYAFSHLTFQEYLTARHITENIHDMAVVKSIERNVSNDQWKEVFLMTASLLPNGQVLLSLLQRALKRFVGACPALSTLFQRLDGVELSAKSRSGEDQFLRLPPKGLGPLRELALSLAGNYHYEPSAPAIRRIRALAISLHDSSSPIMAWMSTDMVNSGEAFERMDALQEYLAVANTYAECLWLAAVSDRTAYINAILDPRT